MSVSYWKTVGENIAKGLGAKTIRRLGTGGKFIGRAGAVVGVGFLAYELFKNYKENIEAEPAYKEMMILQAELENTRQRAQGLQEDTAFAAKTQESLAQQVDYLQKQLFAYQDQLNTDKQELVALRSSLQQAEQARFIPRQLIRSYQPVMELPLRTGQGR